MPQAQCVLCSRKLKIHQRRPVNKHISKYLRKTFLLECTTSDFICGKYSRPAYPVDSSLFKAGYKQQTNKDEISSSVSLPVQTQSPLSVCLKIRSASKSHAYCFICKKPGPKLVVVPVNVRTDVFLKHSILITAQSSCCPGRSNANFVN